MANNRCLHCRFYVGGKQSGNCHRFPPTNDRFPKVLAEEWCGEWAFIKEVRRYDAPGASLVDRVTALTNGDDL